MGENIMNYSRELNGNNSTNFYFKFTGLQKYENVNIYEIDRLVNDFMYNVKDHSKIINDISCLRTIFESYNEYFLELFYSDNLIKQKVIFDNTHLIFYEKKERDIEKRHIENLIIKYEVGNKLDISVVDSKNNKIENSNFDNIANKITQTLNEIKILDNIRPLELTNNLNIDTEGKSLIKKF